MRIVRLALIMAVTALIAACGSGGSGDGIDGHGFDPAPVPTATTAIVTVGTQSSSGEVAMYGAEFVLRLPAGVTVAADAGSGLAAEGVIAPIDTRATVSGRYSPATATSQASLKVNVADPLGFTVGDLATVSCSISAGTTVNTAAFALDRFSAKNKEGASISGITPRFAVQTK